jgi:hypothetical protein
LLPEIKEDLVMVATVILTVSIIIQFIPAFLAMRLVWISKEITAWALISGAGG